MIFSHKNYCNIRSAPGSFFFRGPPNFLPVDGRVFLRVTLPYCIWRKITTSGVCTHFFRYVHPKGTAEISETKFWIFVPFGCTYPKIPGCGPFDQGSHQKNLEGHISCRNEDINDLKRKKSIFSTFFWQKFLYVNFN